MILWLLQAVVCFVFPFFCNDTCDPNPCQNGGTCQQQHSWWWLWMLADDDYECVDCNAGWTGHDCDEDIDECLVSAVDPCSTQEGLCRNTPGSYECVCNAGWTGINCDEDIDECLVSAMDLCNTQEGNICRNTPGSYDCVCIDGWTGINCDQDVNECLLLAMGANCTQEGQVCQNTPGSYECVPQQQQPQAERLPLLLENRAGVQGTYESCSDLRADLVTAAGYLANITMKQNVQWYFYDNWYPPPFFPGSDGPIFPEGSDEPVDIPTNEDSYETNNQVDGVQEADFLQSNGVQAFVAYGQEIVEYDVATNSVVRRTTLPISEDGQDDPQDYCGGGYSKIEGMLLVGGDDDDDDDEELIVFVRAYSYYYCGSATTSRPIIQSQAATKVYRYRTNDMTLRNDPPQNDPPQELFGNYISARAIDKNVHVVTSNWMDSWQFKQFFDPSNEEIYGTNYTVEQYLRNAQRISESRAGAFADQLVTELEAGVGCTSVQPLALLQNTDDALSFAPGIMESFINAHSFSLDTNVLSTRTTMLPSSNWNVYASRNYLVLVGEGYIVEGDESAREESFVIVFELSGASVAAVRAGSVPGYALNQFSIDQIRQWDPASQSDQDFLRIATCTNERWFWSPSLESWEQQSEALCEVNVLDINNNMAIVGTVDKLGKPGDQIFAVRFQGDRGFVVTFRQVDPLYTLNLTSPRDPFAAGELEIPGFSNYLHPINDNWILGVGQDTVGGRSLKISIFQVDDLSAPQERWTYVEEDPSYSAAQFDHRGFRLLPQSKLLILPLVIYGDYGAGNSLDGFRLYRVDTVSEIEPYMSVEHGSGDLYSGCWSSSSLAPRSIVVGGRLHTFKGHTIVVNNLSYRTFIGLTNLDEDSPPEECFSYFDDDGEAF